MAASAVSQRARRVLFAVAACLLAGCQEAPRVEERERDGPRVTVPERDRTPPHATLRLRRDGATLHLTATARDPQGTGRIRVSVLYDAPCEGGTVTRDFPPAQIERIRVAPGARVPAERSRTVRLPLPECATRGRAWADATNAHGLESSSTPVRFAYEPPR